MLVTECAHACQSITPDDPSICHAGGLSASTDSTYGLSEVTRLWTLVCFEGTVNIVQSSQRDPNPFKKHVGHFSSFFLFDKITF